MDFQISQPEDIAGALNKMNGNEDSRNKPVIWHQSLLACKGINTNLQKDQKDDINNPLKEPRHKLKKRRKYENLMK
ncbi:hypothetical protein L2E82_01137 [Cichorium intybus]|uniref:Uncharacterized protein n=1 Tax=Cichorium intybus TaxID=13427 RepID=A0ACB9GY54_CICIN|nr:hypothetical protein L2E82_01137 [Cichorium intybus]